MTIELMMEGNHTLFKTSANANHQKDNISSFDAFLENEKGDLSGVNLANIGESVGSQSANCTTEDLFGFRMTCENLNVNNTGFSLSNPEVRLANGEKNDQKISNGSSSPFFPLLELIMSVKETECLSKYESEKLGNKSMLYDAYAESSYSKDSLSVSENKTLVEFGWKFNLLTHINSNAIVNKLIGQDLDISVSTKSSVKSLAPISQQLSANGLGKQGNYKATQQGLSYFSRVEMSNSELERIQSYKTQLNTFHSVEQYQTSAVYFLSHFTGGIKISIRNQDEKGSENVVGNIFEFGNLKKNISSIFFNGEEIWRNNGN